MERFGRNDIDSVSADVILCWHYLCCGIFYHGNLSLRTGNKGSIVGNVRYHIVKSVEGIRLIVGIIRYGIDMGYPEQTIHIGVFVTVT